MHELRLQTVFYLKFEHGDQAWKKKVPWSVGALKVRHKSYTLASAQEVHLLTK